MGTGASLIVFGAEVAQFRRTLFCKEIRFG